MVDAMGDERGDGLMSMLPPTGWADVATKHDLAELERGSSSGSTRSISESSTGSR